MKPFTPEQMELLGELLTKEKLISDRFEYLASVSDNEKLRTSYLDISKRHKDFYDDLTNRLKG